jgi:4-amino-4-deoxy-L-arabinose transferase-like glycosyltransferase
MRGRWRPSPTQLSYALLVVAAGYLLFKNLGDPALWDDEAQVGIIAKNFLKTGHLSGWDGRNLYGFRNGTVLSPADLTIKQPPLMFLVTALSFHVLGVSEWAARMPFAALGFLIIPMLWSTLANWKVGNAVERTLAVAAVALSPTFLLNMRQCRYYALSCFFAVLAVWAWQRSRPWVALAALVLHVYANYLLGTAFAVTFVLSLIGFDQPLQRPPLRRILALGGAFLIATVPYLVATRAWERPDFPVAPLSVFDRKFQLVRWALWDLSRMNVFPVLLVAAVALGWRRLPADVRSLTARLAFLGLVNTLCVALLSPQDPTTADGFEVRYLIAGVPWLVLALALPLAHLCVTLPSPRKVVPAAVLAVWVSSNALTQIPTGLGRRLGIRHFPVSLRLLLPAYVREIHTHYLTSNEAAVRFLSQHVRPGDRVLALPAYFSDPLMFYLGEQVLVCCQITAASPIFPSLRQASFPPYVFMPEHPVDLPEWVVFFGWHRVDRDLIEAFNVMGADGQPRLHYEPYATLPVYYYQTQRPEFGDHAFGPRSSFDINSEGVYVYRQVGALVP